MVLTFPVRRCALLNCQSFTHADLVGWFVIHAPMFSFEWNKEVLDLTCYPGWSLALLVGPIKLDRPEAQGKASTTNTGGPSPQALKGSWPTGVANTQKKTHFLHKINPSHASAQTPCIYYTHKKSGSVSQKVFVTLGLRRGIPDSCPWLKTETQTYSA